MNGLYIKYRRGLVKIIPVPINFHAGFSKQTKRAATGNTGCGPEGWV
jgi:hypothetical protein